MQTRIKPNVFLIDFKKGYYVFGWYGWMDVGRYMHMSAYFSPINEWIYIFFYVTLLGNRILFYHKQHAEILIRIQVVKVFCVCF